MTQHNEIIEEVFDAVRLDKLAKAKKVLKAKYPHSFMSREGRQYSYYQRVRIALRDGFIDRYSGKKMVFPPVLRLLSKLMPKEFPFQEHWKMSECHLAYWHLIPTVDHVIPISFGGTNDEDNLVCTSQIRNSAKSHWKLEELGWKLHKRGNLKEWDGLATKFMDYARKNPKILEDGYMYSWHNACEKAKEKMESNPVKAIARFKNAPA